MDDLKEEKAAAFQAARRKFAAYSRAKRSTGDQSSSGGQLSAADGGLRASSSLQKKGVLSALLADVDYHLTGILDTAQNSRVASNVVALAGLLNNPQTAAAIITQHGAAESQCTDVAGRVRRVLRLLSPKNSPLHSSLLLSISALAYIVSYSNELAKFIIDDQSFARIVHALKDAIAGGSGASYSGEASAGEMSESRKGDVSPLIADCEAELGGFPPKKCLKRKRIETKKDSGDPSIFTAPKRSGITGSGEDTEQTPTTADSEPSSQSSLLLTDKTVCAQITQLLIGHAPFDILEGRLEVSTTDLLYAALVNLLQLEDQSVSGVKPAHDVRILPSTEQQAQNIRETFVRLRNRKLWLMHVGALDAMMQTLPDYVAVFTTKPSDGHNDNQVERLSLHRLHAMLQVMEHASFFAGPVQRSLSAHRLLFENLLTVVHVLSEMCSADASFSGSPQERGFIVSVTDVLQAALRLLINLTHRNSAANEHVAFLGGMRELFDAFCRVCRFTDCAPDSARNTKHMFDSQLLLLSAMVNCVEISEDNRQTLSQLPLIGIGSINSNDDINTAPSSVCNFLTRFFCRRALSYIPGFNSSEHQSGTNPNQKVAAIDHEDWDPDDVILSGCCVLLLGCLMKDSQENVNCVLDGLPEKSPRVLLRALAVFTAFHSQIGALTPEVASSVLQVELTLKRVSYDENWSTPRLDTICANTTEAVGMTPLQARTPERRQPSPKLTTPSPGRRRNLCSSLSDSDDETAPKRVSSMAVPSLEEIIRESTGESERYGRSTPAHTPSRSRRSPRSPFRMPSPRRPKKNTAKNIGSGLSSSTTLSSAGNTSRKLLREARSLINDLDAELARSSFQSHTHSSSTDTSKSCVGQTSSDAGSGEVAEEDIEMAVASPAECSTKSKISANDQLENGSSPFRTNQQESKRKKKDYRLPTSPFYRLGGSTPMSTPPRNKLQMTPPRRLMQSLQLVEQSGSLVNESPARRKPKAARASVTSQTAAIFDFDE